MFNISPPHISHTDPHRHLRIVSLDLLAILDKVHRAQHIRVILQELQEVGLLEGARLGAVKVVHHQALVGRLGLRRL